MPRTGVELVEGDHELHLGIGDRSYRVRGFEKNLSYGALKVNLMARHGDLFHADTLDLYQARQRAAFVHQASVELGQAEERIKRDLGQILLKLEALQADQIKRTLEVLEPEDAIDAEVFRGAGEVAAPYEPAFTNFAVSTPIPHDDFVAAGIRGVAAAAALPAGRFAINAVKIGNAAKSVNAPNALARKLSALENAQATAVRTRVLTDGRSRYYKAERPARTAGPSRGSTYVTEWNPKTGSVRSWNEVYDESGNVSRVHPKMIDGLTLKSGHYPPTAKELR